MNYILECKRFDKINLNDIKENGIVESKIYTWLNSYNPSLWDKNKKAREILVDILTKEYGARLAEINNLKWSNNELDKNYFSLIGIDSTFMNELIKFQERENEFSTVEECLNKIVFLSKPFFAVVLTNINANDSKHCIDSLYFGKDSDNSGESFIDEPGYSSTISEIKPTLFQRILRINKVGYKNGHFKISVTNGGINTQTGYIQLPDIPIIGMQEKIEINSFTTLLNIKSVFQDELYTNSRLFNRIKSTYGKLYLDDCIRLLSQENSKSFKSITIFGFQFSRQRLLFVFLFFFLIASGGIYLSTTQAKNNGMKVISNVVEEDALFMLIENKFARFFMWCICPVLVILMNFEYNISSFMTFILTLILLMIVLFLNIKSFAFSLKL